MDNVTSGIRYYEYIITIRSPVELTNEQEQDSIGKMPPGCQYALEKTKVLKKEPD